MAGLSFVTLLAYDWKYAFSAIRGYYDIADEILLGIDRDRISWSGKPFVLDDQALARFIAEIDGLKKIRVQEGNFHSAGSPLENDTMERRELGCACRAGNWVVQIDSDEVLANAGEFRSFMEGMQQDCCVRAHWLSVYKIMGDKALVIGGVPESPCVATRSPQRYISARVTDQPQVVSPLRLLHMSWGRTEEELVQKLTNWSHSRDFDVAAAVGLWRSVNLSNYHTWHNFHPMYGPTWPYLEVRDWNSEVMANIPRTGQGAAVSAGQEAQRSPVTVEGRTAAGGVLISFGARR